MGRSGSLGEGLGCCNLNGFLRLSSSITEPRQVQTFYQTYEAKKSKVLPLDI